MAEIIRRARQGFADSAAVHFVQVGPLDILLFFDGRNPTSREAMAKVVKEARHLCEVWIVYDDQRRPGRRVA